jgi:ammonia channel protein AmtB
LPDIDPAATAWLLASTALVLLMTPGLAIFYGGMVRTTGVLNMIMMSFISIPLVAVVGLAAGIVCSFAAGAKFRFGYDDSLDVVGVHFVGGVVGVLLIGLLAIRAMTGDASGLFYAGGFA